MQIENLDSEVNFSKYEDISRAHQKAKSEANLCCKFIYMNAGIIYFYEYYPSLPHLNAPSLFEIDQYLNAKLNHSLGRQQHV